MTTSAGRGEQPGTDIGQFTEVPIFAGVLRPTAELLHLLGEFFTDTDAEVRSQLGRFMADRQPDSGDPAIEAAITIQELTEAADLLHTLAGHPDDTPARRTPPTQAIPQARTTL